MANNVSIWLAEILPQLALILMIAGLVLVTILAFTFQRRERDIDKALAVTRNDLGYAQREKQRLDESIINLAKKKQRLQSEVETWKAKHGELYSDFERLYRDGLLERWFMFLKSAKFSNRGELGAYVLYPMLWFLQYPESAFRIDPQVAMLGATAGPTETVRCMVFGVDATGTEVPLFLLDTISPDESFTTQSVDKIVLKAYPAKVVKFAMTNGEEFILYNLLNRSTAGGRVRQFPLKNLRENWQFVQRELHPGAFQF